MKKKVAVLFGGRSTEHEVSRISAYSIIKHIDKELFDVIMIGVTKQGEWLPYQGDLEALPDGSWERFANPSGKCSLQKGIEALEACDVILPVLHGQNGEDGTVQGLFELLGIPYVGCGVFASAACMDKVYTKIILKNAGIPQCRHVVAYRHILERDPHAYDQKIASELGFPCFVKPANSGSSVGVHKVKTAEALTEALLDAQKYDRKIVIEEFVDGREIECSVLGNLAAAAAMPGEIKPSKEFYDYEDKYIKGCSITTIPADIPPEALERVKTLALKAFAAMDCSGLARIDFFYKKDGSVILNELNTLPGFTDISMYSKLWIAEGISYTDLLTRLIRLAFERKIENQRCTE